MEGVKIVNIVQVDILGTLFFNISALSFRRLDLDLNPPLDLVVGWFNTLF